MSKVQIVIPAINLWNKYTYPCIVSVLNACEGLEHRILLIDNGSTDETLVEASNLVSNTFAHKRNEERWGCSQSWNFGIRDAFERGFDYVFVINNDVLVHPEAIKRLIGRFEEAKRIHIPLPQKIEVSGPMIGETPTATVTEETLESQILAMATCMNIAGQCTFPQDLFRKNLEEFKSVGEAEHPDFSGFMINRNCWEKVGEFDEGFAPAYFEDNDYHLRINKVGLKAITYPSAVFYHFGSKTRIEADNERPVITNDSFEKNRSYYIAKWGGLPSQETYENPFNSGSNSIKWTKQQNG
jgi:GT2 family glycosyltransferase